MSIRVNDFRWEPGKNDAEYIKLLESSRDEWQKMPKALDCIRNNGCYLEAWNRKVGNETATV